MVGGVGPVRRSVAHSGLMLFRQGMDRAIHSFKPGRDLDCTLYSLMRKGAGKGFYHEAAKARDWMGDKMLAAAGLEYITLAMFKAGLTKARIIRYHALAVQCAGKIPEEPRRILVKKNIILDMMTQGFTREEIVNLFRDNHALLLDSELLRETGIHEQKDPLKDLDPNWKNHIHWG